MRFFQKIALAVLFVALVPLSVVGFSLVGSYQNELARIVADKEQAQAAACAERLARQLADEGQRIVTLIGLVDPGRLSEEEKVGLMRALYQLEPDIVSVTWLDSAGLTLRPIVALALPPVGRLATNETQQQVLRALGPRLAELNLNGASLGLSEPQVIPGRPWPSLFFVTVVDDYRRERLAIEVELRREKEGSSGAPWMVVDEGGRLVFAPDEAITPFNAVVTPDLVGKPFRLTSQNGEPFIGAAAPLGMSGLFSVVYEPEATAFGVLKRMRFQTLLGLVCSAALSLGLGWFLSRGLRRRLKKYAVVASALARGELSTRVGDTGNDELGSLAIVLDDMASALEQSWNAIGNFNIELQQRVDERTAELRAAQARLVQVAKLNAVGQLGAGVAHEIGNPLARIIGQAQLLKLDETLAADKREALEKIENAALRVSDITRALLRFSETQALPNQANIVLADCAREAMAPLRARFITSGITLVLQDGARAVVTGKSAQIVQAIFQLLENARAATATGGTVTVATTFVGEKPALYVEDNGKGIAGEHLERLFDPFFTTKTVWQSPGLGLSLVYRIMEEHGGEVKVTSTVGVGTRVLLSFGEAR